MLNLAKRIYLDARGALTHWTGRGSVTAVAATTLSSSQTWIPQQLVGLNVEITSGTGDNQTRRIAANTAIQITVSPSWATNPGVGDSFAIMPERLYGDVNNVMAIGVDEGFIAENRNVMVGTSGQGGGVTNFQGMGINWATDLYHADAALTTDVGTSWNQQTYDDIKAIDIKGIAMAIGSAGINWQELDDKGLQEGLDEINNNLNSIKYELMADSLNANGADIGPISGADIAEWYDSTETLIPGDIVSLDVSTPEYVTRSKNAYDSDIIGVVATKPGIVLGDSHDGAYPVALAGRLPVNVSSQNGVIMAGDRITASSIPGIGMEADLAGRVIGVALSDFDETTAVACTDHPEYLCGQVLTFMNLADFLGKPMNAEEFLHPETSTVDGLKFNILSDDPVATQSSALLRQQQILSHFADMRMRDATAPASLSALYTDKVIAVSDITSPRIVAEEIIAKRIRADRIEGLEVIDMSIAKSLTGVETLGAAFTNLSDRVATLSADLLRIEERIPTASGSASESGTLSLVFSKVIEFMRDVVFKSQVEFAKNVIFKDKVLFDSDTAGIAVVKKTATKVNVTFDTPYSQIPVVVISVQLPVRDDTAFLEEKVRVAVSDVSQKGFTVVLSEPLPRDTHINWIALAANGKNGSVAGASTDTSPTPEPTRAPEIASPSATPVPTLIPSPTPLPEGIVTPTPEPSPVRVLCTSGIVSSVVMRVGIRKLYEERRVNTRL
jgi:hypothetical protein